MRCATTGIRTVHACSVAVLMAGLVASIAAQVPSRPFGLPNVPRESQPTAGMLLVASRTLNDPNFAQTVIVLTEYSTAGAVGLVLNRRTEVALARVFPSLAAVPAVSHTVFQGGPVEVTTAQALRRGRARSGRGRQVADDLHVIGTPEALEAQMAESVHPDDFRVYLGYAGWSAKQLDGEVSLGAWHVFPADSSIVFDGRPDTLWERQIRRTDWRQAARPASASPGNSTASQVNLHDKIACRTVPPWPETTIAAMAAKGSSGS